MKVYIAKVGDFTPDSWPVLSAWYSNYESESLNSCKRLIDEVGTENPVLIVGSTANDTPRNKRGMIIGICLLGNTIHATQEVVSEQHASSQLNLRPSNNKFRWPFGVAISRAIQFQEPYVNARAVCPEVFGTNESGEIWGRKPLFKKLSETEAATVIERIKLRDTGNSSDKYFQAQPMGSLCNLVGEHLNSECRSRGPLPTTSRSFALNSIYESTSTYLFRFSTMDCWKVGITGRLLDIRLSELNKYVPSRILEGGSWKRFRVHRWDTKQKAYEMEQRILDLIEEQSLLIAGEVIYCDQNTICRAWNDARDCYV